MAKWIWGAAALLAADVALAQATTTQWPTGIGFPNVPRTQGERLAGPFATGDGRGAIIAWHNGVLFTSPEAPSSNPGSNIQARMWNIEDPANPRIIVNAPANAQGSLGTSPMAINAHGYLHVGQNMANGTPGHWLVLGADWPPESPWSFRATAGQPGITRQASQHFGAGVRGNLYQPWYIEQTWWSYGAVSGNAAIYTNGPPGSPGSTLQSSWDHLGTTGVIGHPFLLGNLLIYASDQSRTGVATYDISNPQQPVLLDVLRQGGPGGYWPELWANDGELYLVFPYNDGGGNGFRMVDVTDPTALRFVADVPLPRPNGSSGAMYAQFQDEFGFIGDHKIDMRTRSSVHQFATLSQNIDMSQFALPIGNLLVTGGIGNPGQGYAIFAHQAAPDTRPPSVAFSIPRPGQTQYPRGAPISLIIHETLNTLSIVNGVSFMVRQQTGPGVFGTPLPGRWTFSFNDVLTFQPNAPLAENATYEVRVDGIADAAGNAMAPYAFSFSTGQTNGGNRPPSISSFAATPYPAAPGQSVDFVATATDPDGNPLEYRFDFGDGSPRTAWGSASASRSYAQPGHYRATVQVRDPSGVVVSRTRVVTVLTALAATRPTASAPLVCDTSARRVYTVNPDANTISVLNADTLAKLAEYPTCSDPRAIASQGSELWVACHDDDRVRVHQASTGAVLATIETGYGSAPIGIAIAPDGVNAFVSLSGRGELRRYSVATRTQNGTLALGRTPRGIAISADGARVLVTRFLSPQHYGEVWDVAAATMTLTRSIRIPKIGDQANRDTTASGRGIANYLAAVAISPRSGRAFVPANKPNNEKGLLIHPSTDLDQDNTVRNLLVELDPGGATAQDRFRRAIDIDNSDSASSVAFSPLGDYVLVTLQGMDELLVLDALALDANTGFGSVVTRIATGAAPQGVCTDAVTQRTFVHNFMGRSLSVLDTAALYAAGDIQVPSSTVSMVATELLPAQVLQGKRIFYNASDPRMSAEGYLSCATCHLDGGEDGRVWDFTGRGEGLRNTTTLNGRGGLAHGRVHWSANFDEIQDFENDVRGAFGGSGFLSNTQFAATSAPLGAAKAGLNADLDALAAYVASLNHAHIQRSPFRNADGSNSAAALQGQGIFERENCASCHTPPRYTNSATASSTLVDVGTLRPSSGNRLGAALTGIDVPTLRGLHNSAPYLHDGSAATIDDVFRYSGGISLPAETGSLSGGATVVNSFVDLNNDDSVRGRAYVQLEAAAHRLSFSGINGGAGGNGALELRYSNSRGGAQTQALTVTVNGVALPTINLPATDNDPNWRSTNWNEVRIENVPLNPGSGNTIELATNAWYLAVDEILVANADRLALAQAHRRVLALPSGERAALLSFLRELDGSGAVSDGLFANGFE